MKNNPHPQLISNNLLFHTSKIENQRWKDWRDGWLVGWEDAENAHEGIDTSKLTVLSTRKIASRFMVQCQKGEPFECPYLNTCPHDDKDVCQWQLDQADEMVDLFTSSGYRQIDTSKLTVIGDEDINEFSHYDEDVVAEDNWDIRGLLLRQLEHTIKEVKK